MYTNARTHDNPRTRAVLKGWAECLLFLVLRTRPVRGAPLRGSPLTQSGALTFAIKIL